MLFLENNYPGNKPRHGIDILHSRLRMSAGFILAVRLPMK